MSRWRAEAQYLPLLTDELSAGTVGAGGAWSYTGPVVPCMTTNLTATVSDMLVGDTSVLSVEFPAP